MNTANATLRPIFPAVLALLALLPAATRANTAEHGGGDLRGDLANYESAIADVERAQGAYGAGLAEPLLALGLALQSQGRHAEAVTLFKRGVHLTRVNDGLYSTRQIPLLQGEINSHIATGDYAQADDRQRYLYRVQLRGMESGESLTTAFMQQATWQYEAYQMRLGANDYTRLMNMWDLYRLALNDVMAREGETSPNLLPPLHGMLQAQYLISGYDWAEHTSGGGEDIRSRQELHRFSAYRAQSYDKGDVVIRAIRSVEQEQPETPASRLAAARAMVMLGDWHLYHDNRQAALDAYAEAQAELAALDDAQAQVETIFGDPVALPDVDGLRELPAPVEPEAGDVLVQFDVSEYGRARGLERLDDNEALDGRANRLMRKMRKVRFRPRFEAGQPVEAQDVVRAYRLQ